MQGEIEGYSLGWRNTVWHGGMHEGMQCGMDHGGIPCGMEGFCVR